MTTTVLSPSRPAVRVTPRGVAVAEWIKLRSLRSAAWLLAGIVVSIVGIGVMPALGVAVGALPPVRRRRSGGRRARRAQRGAAPGRRARVWSP